MNGKQCTKMINLMLDTETLGLNDNAVIIQLGAALFNDNFEVVNTFDQCINVDDSESDGFTYSDSTIKWWQQQNLGPVRFDKMFNSTNHPRDVAINFNTWLKSCAGNQEIVLWVSGLLFDVPKVDNLLTKYDIDSLTSRVKYYNIRDLRSIRLFAESMLPEKVFDRILNSDGYTKHDALQDCLYQIKVLAQITRVFNAAIHRK